MSDIRASEIDQGMHIREFGDDESFVVANVEWFGDSILVTDQDGSHRTFDRDEVVDKLPR